MWNRTILTAVVALLCITGAGSARMAAAQGGSLPKEIVGSEWTLVSLQKAAGDVQDTGPKGLNITFNADGTVFGAGGCNTFRGGYTAGGGQQVKMGPLAATLIGCEGPIATLEGDYFAALDKVTMFAMDSPGQLKLSSADGQVVLTYAKPTPATMPETGGANDIVGLLGIAGLLVCVAGFWITRRRVAR